MQHVFYFLIFSAQFLSVLGQTTPSRSDSYDELQPETSEVSACRSQLSNTFFNQGIRLAIATLKSRLPDGIPEYGIPPLEPFVLEDTYEFELSKPPLEMIAVLTNIKIRGLTTFTKNNWFIDTATRILDMAMEIPSLHITANYTLRPAGHFGNLTIFLDRVTLKAKIKLKILDTTKNNVAIKAERALADLKFDKIRMKASPVFLGDGYEEINHALDVFTQQQSELLYKEVKPFVKSEAEKIILKIADAVLSSSTFTRRYINNYLHTLLIILELCCYDKYSENSEFV